MRTINLIGVYDDGSTRRADQPLSGRTTLRITRGEDTAIVLVASTPSGRRINALAADTLTLSVKENAGSGTPILLSVAGVAQPNGAWLLTVPRADTLAFPPGRFDFDIWLLEQSSGLRTCLNPLSTLISVPNLA